MSTASKGKSYERALVRALRSLSLHAERVPRSVADAMPGPIDDVVCASPDTQVADHDNRPITSHLQDGLVDDPAAFAEYLGELVQVEVKYTKNETYGLSGLYSTHLETVGLGSQTSLAWPSGRHTGGVAAFAAWMVDCAGEGWEYDDGQLASSTTGLLDEADAAALKAPRRPWVVVWEG